MSSTATLTHTATTSTSRQVRFSPSCVLIPECQSQSKSKPVFRVPSFLLRSSSFSLATSGQPRQHKRRNTFGNSSSEESQAILVQPCLRRSDTDPPSPTTPIYTQPSQPHEANLPTIPLNPCCAGCLPTIERFLAAGEWTETFTRGAQRRLRSNTKTSCSLSSDPDHTLTTCGISITVDEVDQKRRKESLDLERSSSLGHGIRIASSDSTGSNTSESSNASSASCDSCTTATSAKYPLPLQIPTNPYIPVASRRKTESPRPKRLHVIGIPEGKVLYDNDDDLFPLPGSPRRTPSPGGSKTPSPNGSATNLGLPSSPHKRRGSPTSSLKQCTSASDSGAEILQGSLSRLKSETDRSRYPSSAISASPTYAYEAHGRVLALDPTLPDPDALPEGLLAASLSRRSPDTADSSVSSPKIPWSRARSRSRSLSKSDAEPDTVHSPPMPARHASIDVPPMHRKDSSASTSSPKMFRSVFKAGGNVLKGMASSPPAAT